MMNKILVKLIHWNQAEAKELAGLLNQKKYKINYSPFNPGEIKEIKNNSPSLFIIDLSRLPSQGRDLGIFLRKNKTTRDTPIIFADGDPEKINKIKAILPDAFYSSWNNIEASINNSLNQKKEKLIIPNSVFAGYQGTPLIKKLGIKPHLKIAVINAPDNIVKILGDLPEGIVFQKRINQPDLIIWFVTSIKEFGEKIKQIKTKVGKDGLWVVYPKKGSKFNSDLSQIIIRNTGLSIGLVDYKVCSVSNTWSGLKFAVRKSNI